MVLAGFVGGFGWFWVDLDRFGWFWVVPCFSNYVKQKLHVQLTITMNS